MVARRTALLAMALLFALVPRAAAQLTGTITIGGQPPRIMYWYGKVNQHFDLATQSWQTDPDGSSGADLDMLAYCRRWYPATRAVVPFAQETISTWRAAGNVGAYTSTQQSYQCVQ